MSKDNVKKFFTELEKNPQLKEKYAEAMKEYQKESDKILADKLLDFARKSGFGFTEPDLHETHAELIDTINANDELNDMDLESVAGGKGDMFDQKTKAVLASLTLFGLGCAVQSIYQEVQGPGRCGAYFTRGKKC